MEKLREELCSYIKKYGISDSRTIAKSQELDKAIVHILQSTRNKGVNQYG